MVANIFLNSILRVLKDKKQTLKKKRKKKRNLSKKFHYNNRSNIYQNKYYRKKTKKIYKKKFKYKHYSRNYQRKNFKYKKYYKYRTKYKKYNYGHQNKKYFYRQNRKYKYRRCKFLRRKIKISLKKNRIFKSVFFFILKYFILLRAAHFLIKSTLEKKKPTIFQFYNYNFLFIFSKIKKIHKSLNLISLINLAMKNLQKTKGRFFISLIPLLRTLRYFYNRKAIQGYKLICKGRFSRRQRASKRVFQEGSISFGNIKSKTDYIFKDVVLKNSICGFKLYVTYRDYDKKKSKFFFEKKK